jgi:hypothetical protein
MEKMDNETRQRNTYLGQQWSEGVEGWRKRSLPRMRCCPRYTTRSGEKAVTGFWQVCSTKKKRKEMKQCRGNKS